MGVVLVSCQHAQPFYRQFPNDESVWGGWKFLFNDPGEEKYDYLVVVDEPHAPIELRCPVENTIHVSSEAHPHWIYYPQFTRQFSICLTLERDHDHPMAICIQPALAWLLGWDNNFGIGWDSNAGGFPEAMSFKELETLFDEPRTKLISIISSNRTHSRNHRKRIAFAKKLKSHFGDDIDFFGRGFRTMTDKLEALRDYRFHVAVENIRADHYFSEKFSDCVIAGCYPIYHGCPNIAEYFPEDAFSTIDIDDFKGSVATIERAISGNYDQTRREALREARRRVMYEHNLFPMLVRIIEAHQRGEYGNIPQPVHYSHEILPTKDPRLQAVLGHKSGKLRRWLSKQADNRTSVDVVRKIYAKTKSIL